ncbi:MAG: N-6 DNA methylase [Muribaculaceae bacterium]|nr:N-6 DNA methylase [Muribaculaceae bacterium]
MKEVSLQFVVNQVVNSLVRSGVFRDRVEIVKDLLALLYYNDISSASCDEEKLKNFESHSDHIIFKTDVFFRNFEIRLPYEHSSRKLLDEAVRELTPFFQTSKNEVTDAIISCASIRSLGKQGLVTEPEDIAHLLAFIAKSIGMESVYDPFAGLASYATTSEFEGISFKGAELSPDAADIANLRLLINGRKPSVDRINSFATWNHTSFNEDFVTVPPFAVSMKDYEGEIGHSLTRSEDFIIEQIIERDDIRKAIVVLPLHRFATSSENCKSREYLVRAGMLEMIISLPSSSLFETSIPTAIVVINKDRSESNSDNVTFISLLDCIKHDYKDRFRLDLAKAKELIASREGRLVKTENWSDIIDNYETPLNPGAYLLDRILPSNSNYNYPYGLYSSILEKEIFIPSIGKKQTVVGIKDLEEEYTFSKTGVKATSQISSKYYEITQPTILIGLSASRLKVGIAYPLDEPLYVSAEIAAIKLKEDWIDTEYLLLELTKPYIQEQIRLLGYDRNFRNIDTILQDIKILYPSLTIQKELVNEAKAKMLAKFQHVISSTQRDFRKDVHMKRHAMGQTIQTVGNWWKVLETARSKGNLISEDALVGGGDISLGEVLDNIRSCIARVKVQIDKLDRGYKAQPIKIDLIDFIETYKSTHRSPVFHYSDLDYERDLDDSSPKKPEYNVLFPSEVLTMILNNIVSNASSHGFNNAPSPANMIKFGIENIGGNFVVSVANNGKPCPPDMTPEQMIKYGESSDLKHHCGIGGYEINQLMTDFEGSVDILLDAEAEFPVEYRLTFKAF